LSPQQLEPALRSHEQQHVMRRRALAIGAFATAIAALVITVVASLDSGGSTSSSVPFQTATTVGKHRHRGAPTVAAPPMR
jgi:ferric-dicitrate binding protein FerR (iron transport regulator)